MADGKYERSSDSVETLEETLVKHFFYALDRLQHTWMEGDKVETEKFNLQILYLIRALPTTDKQRNKILEAWAKSQSEMAKLPPELGLTTSEIKLYSGMEVVSMVMQFICQNFELVNTDITGPGTSKQFREVTVSSDGDDLEESGILQI